MALVRQFHEMMELEFGGFKRNGIAVRDRKLPHFY